ncbi:MAG TPA: phosphate acyltransferase PlsX [Verrucomicrobiae bacterium]|jgi:glycerol-3-phosphate acyltransferase PlsX|nr:phosphate acyltransferase PlsX [Verrucomicrobiae bacterium]
MRIVVDVMGGDHGAGVIVEGVRLALQAHATISEVYLVGRQEQIEAALAAHGKPDPRIRIFHCTEALSMEDKPVEALRRKKDCSILRAVDLIKEGRGDALISSGNTGGLVAASTIRLRPLEGVDRPCIATVIPGRGHDYVLLDAGASVECRPNQLVHFAVMGSIYAREILGHKNPRVGLLSNGAEPNKGTELTLEAHKLCQMVDLNFIGNVEGHDLFSDRMDVVVCDGFVGNIVLKTIESFAKGLFSWIKDEVTQTPTRKLGAMLVKPGLKTIAQRMDPDNHGGAPLLGLNGTIIKAHGSARERAITSAIGQCTKAVQHRLNEIIVREIAAANDRIAAAKA